jgi:hypothetical protein
MLTKAAVAIGVICLVLPATMFAQGFVQGDKELLLNGSGTSDKDFDTSMFTVQGSFGYFFTNRIEGAIRQSVGFSNIEHGGSSWAAATRGAVDYNFDLGRFWPFVGGNLGYVYGDGVKDTWEAGIEGGLKFFVNSTTFILGQVEYLWFLNNDDTNNEISDGEFVYTVGIGFKW